MFWLFRLFELLSNRRSEHIIKLYNMKKIFKITLWLLALIVFGFGLFIAVMWSMEWRPNEIEDRLGTKLDADTIRKDTLKIVSWNIGYAGLGADMDFFYDGGTRVQATRERTLENLKAITEFLVKHGDADFILLQEVDFESKRSYRINEYDSIRDALPEFMGWWGYNYVSPFVPIPVTDPIGAVRSGVVTLSRYAPEQVVRLQYPSQFSFPTRLFNLKRCLLSASFYLSGTAQMLYINNTHNMAYDTGGMRSAELEYLRNYLYGKPYSVTAGDWNSNPVGYQASKAELDDPNFSPMQIKATDFPSDMKFMSDASVHSTRYGYEPYNAATTTRTLLDFALCGAEIEPLSVETVDLGFENSDHNPVIFKIVILKK